MGKKASTIFVEWGMTCLLFVGLVSVVVPMAAVNEDVRLHPFATEQRLPTNQVRQVYEGIDGEMWIATFSGLARYANGALRIFRSNLFSPELLPCNNVICVCEDNKQRLWIGTERGLCRLDRNTGRIVQIPLGRESELRVNELLVSRDETVYAGMIRGMMRYDETTKRMVEVGLEDVNIQSLAEMPNGDILVGSWGKGLFVYSPKEGSRNVRLSETIASKTILALHYDNRKCLWAGTLNEGLCQLTVDGNGVWQIVNRYADKSIPSNCVYSIAEKNGRLLAGTRKGLFVEGNSDLLKGDEVLGVCVDSKGHIWVATKGFGLYTTSEDGGKEKQENMSSYQVLTDKENGTWEARNYGVAYRSASSSRSVILLSTLRPYRLSQTGNGRVLIPMHDAGLYIAYKGKVEKHLSRKGGDLFIPHDLVHHALEDSRGNLWVATRLGVGVRMRNGQGHVLSEKPSAPNYLSEETYFLAEDRDSTVWAATAEGMLRCDSTLRHYSLADGNFPIGNPMAFCQDAVGRIWVGTDGMGLCLYDNAKDCFLSVHEQLRLPGDIVTDISLAEDSSLLVNVGTEVINLSNSELASMRRNVKADEPKDRGWIIYAVAVFLVGLAVPILYRRHFGIRKAQTFQPSESAVLQDVEATDLRQEFTNKVTTVILEHLSDCDFDVPQLANELSMSRTTLHRRMKEMTGKTTSAFIRDIRMQEARRILSSSSNIRVNEVAYRVGFNDPKYFSHCFKEKFGMLPGEYSQENNVAK